MSAACIVAGAAAAVGMYWLLGAIAQRRAALAR
jgi:hypothetical protein